MNFDFTEEQTMLKDSVARFIQDEYDFDTRRTIADSTTGMSEKVWSTFAELGWLSIPFDEEQGGFGGNVIDMAVVIEEMGKGLVVEPFLATVVMFGGLLQKSTNSELQKRYIPSIIDGSCQGSFAYLERQSRHELADVATTATAKGDDYIISGEKVVVANGVNADTAIVSARTSGDQSDQQGISLFVVDLSAAGVSRIDYAMMDGAKVANIRFDNVSVPAANLVGELGAGWDLMDAVNRDAIIALSAEALGIMGKLNATTCEYTKVRKQFGVAISSFQVLQHRMVDTFMAYEQAKSMLFRTLCEATATDGGDDLPRCIHALKTMIARSGKLIGDEAIQIHGGMGMTDELDVGHYVKRLLTINNALGNGDFHQQKFSALSYGS